MVKNSAMIILLSPSKTLDMESDTPLKLPCSEPALLSESKKLITQARKLSMADIKGLMKISDKLAELNFDRFKRFKTPFSNDNAKPAMYAFKGDVYDGLDAESLSKGDVQYANKHLRILSGLYGVLRPLDLMQAYRLEMGIKLANPKGKDLYQFWGDQVSAELNAAAKSAKTDCVINLASNEYFKAVDKETIKGTIITPVFKEKKGNGYKIIGLMAKRARGKMARWIIENKIESSDELIRFNVDGYAYDPEDSTTDMLVFKRA
ncbi:MAG: peroxide stress protein YaaA [Rickettsiales bacterium]|nr:peroxide stress protein YaaA [Rickettsiales bacterium]